MIAYLSTPFLGGAAWPTDTAMTTESTVDVARGIEEEGWEGRKKMSATRVISRAAKDSPARDGPASATRPITSRVAEDRASSG